MKIFFTKNKAKMLNVTTTNVVVKQVVSLQTCIRTSCTTPLVCERRRRRQRINSEKENT